MSKQNLKTEPKQIDKFREAARELQTDQSEEAFDRVLKKVAKSPPPKDQKSAKESGGKS
ncbi:DNA-binding protein [Mesorhizobium sp. M0500]|uniref:DNA-binding protein n=1 Tax=Mesorhizobium sp. M0500 TaxID=2956953 RepID=UPI003339CCFA